MSTGYGSDKHIVLIALDELEEDNGYTKWGSGLAKLSKGNWTHFSGDTVHHFEKGGGGLAIVLQFEKISVKAAQPSD